MEATSQQITIVNKIRGSKARVLEQIATLGYQDLNKKLVEAGFTKLNRNLSLLKKNDGDIETVLKILSEKMVKKALRLQKKKEKELAGGEGVKTDKRARSEKPLRKTKRTKKSADHITPEDVALKGNEELINTQELSSKKNKDKKEKKERVRRERCEKSEKPKRSATTKQKKERAPREEIVKKYEEWPTSGVNKVFLDGNNMLFADKFLLKLRLKRKQRQAEEALSKLASAFASRVGNFHTVLVYDSIKIPTSKVTIPSPSEGGKSLEFEICSARPKYSTSDDALVEWMDSQSKPEECLVVTSDRGLQVRLKEKGVSHLMKTGNWFRLVKGVLGEEYEKIASEYSVAGKEEGEGIVGTIENGVAKNN